MRRAVLTFVTLLLVPPVAAEADPPGQAPVQPVPAPPTEIDPSIVGIERRSVEDAAAHRAYAATSALIAPGGSVTVDLRAPLFPGLLLQGNISAADTFEVGVLVAGAAVDDAPVVLGGHLKAQLFHTSTIAAAVGVDVIRVPDEEDALVMPALAVSACVDGDACGSLVTLHLTGLGVLEQGLEVDDLVVLPGVSYIVGGRNKFVGEVHLAREDEESLIVGFVGGRFGRRTSVDLGLGFAAVLDDGEHWGPYPWPFFGISSRM